MKKTTGPLHSDSARGQFAKSVIFTGYKNRAGSFRSYFKPKNSTSNIDGFINFCLGPFGKTSIFGESFFGDLIILSGVYKVRPHGRGKISVRAEKSTFKKLHFIPQKENKDKFASAVLAWQDLNDLEKEVWNFKALTKNLEGFNLFIRDYMSS